MEEGKPPPKDDFWPEVLRNLGLLQVVLSEILGFSAAGIGLGYLVSRYLGLPSWGMVVTGSAGLAFGMFRVYLWVQRPRR